jgi:hypothetical protein
VISHTKHQSDLAPPAERHNNKLPDGQPVPRIDSRTMNLRGNRAPLCDSHDLLAPERVRVSGFSLTNRKRTPAQTDCDNSVDELPGCLRESV